MRVWCLMLPALKGTKVYVNECNVAVWPDTSSTLWRLMVSNQSAFGSRLLVDVAYGCSRLLLATGGNRKCLEHAVSNVSLSSLKWGLMQTSPNVLLTCKGRAVAHGWIREAIWFNQNSSHMSSLYINACSWMRKLYVVPMGVSPYSEG